LLFSEEYKGSVYVKGIWVQNHNLIVGLNLKNARLSRDRDLILEGVVTEQLGFVSRLFYIYIFIYFYSF
jgi:hypothetical protein